MNWRRLNGDKIEKPISDAVEAAIIRETEAAESKEEDDPIASVKRMLNMETDAEADAKNNLEIRKEQLQEDLDRELAELKSAEGENLKKTESLVRLQATILPCLPALLLGIFVFVYRFVQERSFTNGRRS